MLSRGWLSSRGLNSPPCGLSFFCKLLFLVILEDYPNGQDRNLWDSWRPCLQNLHMSSLHILLGKKKFTEAIFKCRRKIPSIDGRGGKVTGKMIHMSMEERILLHPANNPLEKVISGLSEFK